MGILQSMSQWREMTACVGTERSCHRNHDGVLSIQDQGVTVRQELTRDLGNTTTKPQPLASGSEADGTVLAIRWPEP